SLYPHVQGMFCEYFVMGERQCYPVAGDISLGELAFAEPLAVALHAVNRGPVLVGKSVLITGAGTIGCLTVIAARLAGARGITVSDVIDRPLATATEVGADRTIRADRDAGALAAPQFDVAYEVSGSFAALKACVAAVNRGGTVVQVGTLPHEPLPFVVNEIMSKELDLKGAFRWAIEFDWAGGSGRAGAQETKLKWAHVYETSEPYHKWSVWAAGEIEKRTAGKYHIDVFPASTLGKESDLNQGMTLGTVDMIISGLSFAA